MPELLLVRTGAPSSEIVRRLGSFQDWFMAALEVPVDVAPASQLPRDPGRYGGIIIMGSLASVIDPLPWITPLGRWALAADRAGVPVLGVCFGHQLIAQALGGSVGPSPSGPELGTTTVHLTPAGRDDPLFDGLPNAIRVQETHGEAILHPPPGAVRLAGSPHTPWQALRAGHALRGVQFHPEMGAHHAAALTATWGRSALTEDSAHGARILRNWLRHFVD